MKNMQKEAEKPLEVVPPTPAVPPAMGRKDEVTNTLNYVNAAHALLENGLFSGKDSNILIQVKAWLENQQKFLQLELAKAITADAEKAGK